MDTIYSKTKSGLKHPDFEWSGYILSQHWNPFSEKGPLPGSFAHFLHVTQLQESF